MRQIRRELDVRYMLEGSVLLDGEQVRVNARLVDAMTTRGLWSERFDTVRRDILEVQDEIVGRLSRAVGLQVIDLEARRSQRDKSKNPEAMDLVMRARAVANRPTSAASMIEARGLFEQAMKLQANNADALAGVASTYLFEVLNDYYPTGNEQRLEHADVLLVQALTIDAGHVAALKAKSALLRAKGEFEQGIAVAKTVLAKNPGEPWAFKEIGLSTMYLGRSTEALDWFAKAERIGPRDPGQWTWLSAKGHALILLGRDAEAIGALRAALNANPKASDTYALLASAYALAGHVAEARAALARYERDRPGMRVTTYRVRAPVPVELTAAAYQHQRERLKEGLRLAGMPE
jgi:TolB-like protein/cytochrome c-type biogenesis protein CcmH/NrfG